MVKFWNYIYICVIYVVINYFFEVFILILGICWLFFFVYDFMVFKIDLKFLKLKEDWIIIYMYKVYKKGKLIFY